jgi:hypothetical protein
VSFLGPTYGCLRLAACEMLAKGYPVDAVADDGRRGGWCGDDAWRAGGHPAASGGSADGGEPGGDPGSADAGDAKRADGGDTSGRAVAAPTRDGGQFAHTASS